VAIASTNRQALGRGVGVVEAIQLGSYDHTPGCLVASELVRGFASLDPSPICQQVIKHLALPAQRPELPPADLPPPDERTLRLIFNNYWTSEAGVGWEQTTDDPSSEGGARWASSDVKQIVGCSTKYYCKGPEVARTRRDARSRHHGSYPRYYGRKCGFRRWLIAAPTPRPSMRSRADRSTAP
jgi:hypothetical protein